MRKLISAIHDWIDSRTGAGSLMRDMLAGTVEKHGAWLKTTGMVCLVLVLVECITGPILAIYYSGHPSSAYGSIQAIDANPFGHFLRGVHHFSSAALILLALVTVIRMFFMAEYKGQRDIVWISALVFLQVVLFFQLTGHLLPWDTNAVGTSDVEAGIANNVWVVGPLVKRVLLGAGSTGTITLSRWYGLHTAVLPIALIGIIGLPLLLNRTRTKRLSGAAEVGTEPYYPNHMAREMVASLLVVIAISSLALSFGAPLEKIASADNMSGYHAMSEWYVLPMHALTLVPPFNNVAFEPIATFMFPGMLIALLFALPFIDKNPATKLAKRKFAILAGGFIIISTIGLCAFAVVKERPLVEQMKAEQRAAEEAAKVDVALITVGQKVYDANGCSGCHKIGGKGQEIGPPLDKTGKDHPDRAWQSEHLVKPVSKVPKSTMPSYDKLKKEELTALAEYMVSLR